jgi:hypothetical protein
MGEVFLAVMVIGILYFIPASVAINRGHHNAGAIFALNLFLGWSLIGWVLALVWALTNPAPGPNATKSHR